MAVQALDIIKPALRRIGAIGATETPDADQTAVALEALNNVIDTWSVLPFTAKNNTEATVSLPAGTASLTIGPSQTINIPRPYRIESAYTRVQGIDRPIKVWDKAQYDAVSLKSISTTWPEGLWYDGGLPTGRVYFWPLCASTTEVHITVLSQVAQFAASTDSQDLPSGYKRALMLTLAVELADEFNLPVSANLARQQDMAYTALTKQNVSVPDLSVHPRVTSRLGQFLGGE